MKALLGIVIGTLIFTASATAQNQNQDTTGGAPMLKSVIHINFSESERQERALGNIENVLKENSKTQIEVVCHGEGIDLLKKQSKHAEQIASLIDQQVQFVACENTMKKKSITKEELIASVTTVPSGALEVMQKQQEGYSYFRP